MNTMASEAKKLKAADRYEFQFGNLDEVLHPSIMLDPGFLNLLGSAIKRGSRLRRWEVEAVFPDIAWDW